MIFGPKWPKFHRNSFPEADEALVFAEDSSSSFMPGSYRRITDESLGGGSRILAMIEVSHIKIVRICIF